MQQVLPHDEGGLVSNTGKAQVAPELLPGAVSAATGMVGGLPLRAGLLESDAAGLHDTCVERVRHASVAWDAGKEVV